MHLLLNISDWQDFLINKTFYIYVRTKKVNLGENITMYTYIRYTSENYSLVENKNWKERINWHKWL